LILGLCIGLPTADPTWAAGIQLLLNPKLLRCKCFLQRGQGGAVCVCNTSMFITKIIITISFTRAFINPSYSFISSICILSYCCFSINWSHWSKKYSRDLSRLHCTLILYEKYFLLFKAILKINIIISYHN